MKILVIYRHFWPDSPPYASMLRSILTALAADGHSITLWAEQPCYKLSDGVLTPLHREHLDGIDVERVTRLPLWPQVPLMRTLGKALFPLRMLVKALWRRIAGERYDLVWTATIPPVVQGLAGRWIAWLFGARFLYHCQDLYPELGAHSGLWRGDGFLHRSLAAIERRTRAGADLLVTLSEDMAATVRHLAQPQRLAIINNFMLEDFSGTAAAPEQASNPADGARPLQLIFAGNLGQFQGLEAVVDAMKLLGPEYPVQLSFLGDGKALPELKCRAQGLATVRFEPHQPFEVAQGIIAAADAGVVSLEPGIYRYAFPSKTLTYLGLSLPVLVVVEPESALAQMIAGQGVGWTAASRSPQDIAAAIRSLVSARAGLADQRRKVRSWFESSLSRPAILARWCAEIRQMEKPDALP